jgi:sortase A
MEPAFAAPAVASPRGRGALFGAALRRPGGRRALSVLSLVLALAGIGMFSYPAITDIIAHIRQNHLKSQFNSPEFQEAYRLHQIKIGQGLTRLIIDTPKVKVDVLVVEGTTPSALKAGAGHYPETPLPCDRGNVGIAGHRTTYGRPFNQIDQMNPGDKVILETPFDRCTYTTVPSSRVAAPFAGKGNPFVVSPDDFQVVEQAGADHWLTLTSCHPKGSAAQRIVLRLELTKVEKLKTSTGKSKSKP